MPNIELHGFGRRGKAIEGTIFSLIEGKAPSININDVVVTIISSVVHDSKGRVRPFVRVASTDTRDRVRVARLILKNMELDVEWLHLDGFFEGVS